MKLPGVKTEACRSNKTEVKYPDDFIVVQECTIDELKEFAREWYGKGYQCDLDGFEKLWQELTK